MAVDPISFNKLLKKTDDIYEAVVVSSKRAKQILSTLESSRSSYNINDDTDQYQLSFIQLDDPIINEIKMELTNIDIDNLTPIEALMKLHDIKRKIGLLAPHPTKKGKTVIKKYKN